LNMKDLLKLEDNYYYTIETEKGVAKY